jgi:hypothetical protein
MSPRCFPPVARTDVILSRVTVDSGAEARDGSAQSRSRDGGEDGGLDRHSLIPSSVLELPRDWIPNAILSGDLFAGGDVPRDVTIDAQHDGYWLLAEGGAVRLTNFTAEIVEDVTHDSGELGGTPRRSYTLRATVVGEEPKTFTLTDDEFMKMKWVTAQLGARAIIFHGPGKSPAAVRTAIQENSRRIERRTVYGHLGWRQVAGRSVYLHSEGGIGPDGDEPDILVEPPAGMVRFVLPEVSSESVYTDVATSLDFIEVAPDAITLPLFAAVWRSILGETDFSIHICGRSGNRKTQLAALVQQHFGAGFDDKHLPASFHDTSHALVEKTHLAKDVVLVVDDYVPQAPGEAGRGMREAAQRLFRALGNRAGRARLGGSRLQAASPPRCLLVTTGEDLPDGPSIRGRVLFIRMPEDAVRLNALTASQEAAREGYFAAALAHFARWLSSRYEWRHHQLPEQIESRRLEFRAFRAHSRTPDILANLDIGMELFLEFAREVNVVTEARANELRQRLRATFGPLADVQRSILAEADPPARFLPLLATAIRSGAAHVATPAGSAPSNPEGLGWCMSDRGLLPQGERIGWVDGGSLYLNFDVAFPLAQRKAVDAGVPLRVSPVVLKKKMQEQGLLLSTEPDRGTLTVRRVVEEQRRDVLHVSSAQIAEA